MRRRRRAGEEWGECAHRPFINVPRTCNFITASWKRDARASEPAVEFMTFRGANNSWCTIRHTARRSLKYPGVTTSWCPIYLKKLLFARAPPPRRIGGVGCSAASRNGPAGSWNAARNYFNCARGVVKNCTLKTEIFQIPLYIYHQGSLFGCFSIIRSTLLSLRGVYFLVGYLSSIGYLDNLLVIMIALEISTYSFDKSMRLKIQK